MSNVTPPRSLLLMCVVLLCPWFALAGEDAAKPRNAAAAHEHAVALRGQKAFANAVAEEALALQKDPALSEAADGLVELLAAAGFPQLARAEAKSWLAAHPRTPAESPVRTLAQLDDPAPAPVVRARPETYAARCFSRLAARLAEAKDRTPAVVHDEAVCWAQLSELYLSEGRVRESRGALLQALHRIWQLRSSDPASVTSFSLGDSDIGRLPAGARVIEWLAVWRCQGGAPDRLLHDLRIALRSGKPALPEGAAPPLPVFQAAVPILDQVALPEVSIASDAPFDSAKAQYHYLFRPEWAAFPQGAFVIEAQIPELLAETDRGRAVLFCPVDQPWVGAEATPVFARKDVPWTGMGEDGGGVPYLAMYNLPSFSSLTAALNRELARPRPAEGIICARACAIKTAPLPKPPLFVKIVLPPGQDAGKLQPDLLSRLESAAFALLRNDKPAARTALQTLLDALEHAVPRAPPADKALVRDLLQLSKEAP